MGVLVTLTGVAPGCGYDNPGFKLKDSDPITSSGAETTSVSGVTMTTTESATTNSAPTTSTADASTSNGSQVSGSGTTETTEDLTTSTSGMTTGDSTGGVTNDCPMPSVVKVPWLADTFLVDRSYEDAASCAMLDEVAPEHQWEQGLIFCRDRNFGIVPALPLLDRPAGVGRDVIHYLVQFNMTKLLENESNEPIEFGQITLVEVVITAKRTGAPIEVGAFALRFDQKWVEGNKFGQKAEVGMPTYRCRKAPMVTDPVTPCGTGAWEFGETPVPAMGSPMRATSTEVLAVNEIAPFSIPFLPTDFVGDLEGFLDPKGEAHHGFFIGLPAFDAESTADKVKVFAKEASETDPVMMVHYCPKG